MRNVAKTICRENQDTFYVKYFVSDNCAVYEIMWRSAAERRNHT